MSLRGEAGETKTFTLRHCVDQILGSSEEFPITITSLNAPNLEWLHEHDHGRGL